MSELCRGSLLCGSWFPSQATATPRIAAAYCLVDPGHALDLVGIAIVISHLGARWLLSRRPLTEKQ